jgi:hypothetical protein
VPWARFPCEGTSQTSVEGGDGGHIILQCSRVLKLMFWRKNLRILGWPRREGGLLPHPSTTFPVHELLREAPPGSYLLEEVDGQRILWRTTGDEPDEATLAPASLWPLFLPPIVEA